MSRGPFGVVQRAVVGAVGIGVRYWWVAALCLGFLPALLLSNVLLGSVTAADWSCSTVEFGAPGSQYGGCSIIAGELIVAVALAWAVPLLLLVALLYLSRRARRGNDVQAVRSGTAGGANGVDRTALFVRVVAVLVGLANMLVIGDPINVVGSAVVRSPALSLGHGLTAVLAGLLASEVVLRRGRSALEGGFLARYGIAVLGLCLGGAMLGGASSVLPGLVVFQPGAQEGTEGGVLFMAYGLLSYGLIAAVVGGVMGALEGLILGLPLAAIVGKLNRGPEGQVRSTSLSSVVLPGLVAVAAVSSYAASPLPESEAPSLANTPPLSCPEYLGEEIASIDGPGNRTTPTFETKGDMWGYQHASAGPGSVSVRVLDGAGREVMPPESSLDTSEGSGGGSAEFGFAGTFSLEVKADDDLQYKVLVCD